MNKDLLKALGMNEENIKKVDSQDINVEDIFNMDYKPVKVKVITTGSVGSKIIEGYKENKGENVTFINMDLNENNQLLEDTGLAVFVGQDNEEDMRRLQKAIESDPSKGVKKVLIMGISSYLEGEGLKPEAQKLADRVEVFIPVIDKEVQRYENNVFSNIDKNSLKERLMNKYLEITLDFLPECTGAIMPIDILEVFSKYKGTAYAAVASASGSDRAKEAANLVLNNMYSLKNYKDSKVIIFNVTGNENLQLLEINDIAEIIVGKVEENVEILFTAAFDEGMEDEIRVSFMGI